MIEQGLVITLNCCLQGIGMGLLEGANRKEMFRVDVISWQQIKEDLAAVLKASIILMSKRTLSQNPIGYVLIGQ